MNEKRAVATAKAKTAQAETEKAFTTLLEAMWLSGDDMNCSFALPKVVFDRLVGSTSSIVREALYQSDFGTIHITVSK